MSKIMIATAAVCVGVSLGASIKVNHVPTFEDYAEDFVGINFGETNDPAPMKLTIMQDELVNGAMCLDGTPTGYYFSPATDPKHANDWQVYFQGGGWCYDAEDCLGRSKGSLGSSTHWAPTSSIGGIMSSDPTSNPDFASFNRVHMPYCDGNSFSGNRDEAVDVNGTKIYFRGRRNIDATFRALNKLGFDKAENVLLTGCSAGGLATYLHTDYVKTLLPTTVKKYKSSPISGFFLLHNNVDNQPVYPTQMKNIFELANSTHGVNDACIAAQAPGDEWKCNFAQEAYAHTEAPIFPLNSALDSWQSGCIYTSTLPPNFPNQTGFENGVCNGIPDYVQCARNPESCNATQMGVMNQYEIDFQGIMKGASTYSKAGNGAFIHSCHTHCEAQSSAWNKFTVNGKTIQQAVSQWWNGADMAPAASNSYSPCLYKTATSPHMCNPTCA